MTPRSSRPPGKLRPLLAWLGLALFVASFVWWQLLPERAVLPAMVTVPRPAAGLGLVIIDAGHGGQDSGTMRSGLMEKDLALDVTRRVDRILQNKGVRTLLTRAGDNYVSLAGRAAAANREENALFVSIHFDEAKPTATGVETYYAAQQSSAPLLASWLPFLRDAFQQTNFESQSLAGFVQEALVARTHAVNRGTRAEQFYVITNVRHPAVLVEGGFLTNNEDIARLGTPEYREALAAAIADGVMKYRDVMRDRQRPISAQPPAT
ncbi:MAG: N-acetylmuramoyl-L-alanine amidase [Chthoniobacterales bacterium]